MKQQFFSKTVNFGFEITIMYEYKNGSEIPVGFVIPSAIPVSDLDLNQLHITLDSYDLVNMIPDISIGEVVGIYVNSADMIN